MASRSGPGQLRGAYLLVTGRAISAFGSALTSFALDVWVYQTTGSYRAFASLAVIAMLPGLVVAPFAGVLIDRAAKKRVLVGCEVSALSAAVIALGAYCSGRLTLAVVAFVMVTLAVVETIRWPTLGVAYSTLSPPALFGRINGLAEAGQALTVIGGPVTGAALLQLVGLGNILVFDAATYLAILTTLVVIRVPEERAGGRSRSPSLGGVWRELAAGLAWLRGSPGLCRLLGFFAGANFAFSVYVVTQAPYVLSFSDARTLGISFASDGLGVLIGGLAFGRWGRLFNLSRLVIAGISLEALTMIAWSFSRTRWILFFCALNVGLLATVVNAASQTVWMSAVPTAYQGRVFSLRSMVVSCLAPLAVVVSIPLSQRLFLPILGEDSSVASVTLTMLWGHGQSGALGMVIASFASLVVLLALAVRLTGGLQIAPAPDRLVEARR